MALVTYKATSPGRRQLVTIDRSELSKEAPEKTLLAPLKKHAGRNNTGRITVRHRGGGHKRKYRIIDFKRNKWDVEGTIERLEYDPNRTAFIAFIRYTDDEVSYILAPQRVNVGDKVIAGSKTDVVAGNAMPLKNIPVGTVIHNIEMKPGKGGQLARSAGAYAQLVGKDGGYAMIRLASGEQRLIHESCMATIGAVSNPDHGNQNLGKAGRKRWMGIRPTVRGVAMNPVDHPMGGGEGKTSGGRHPVTPWGKPTKGARTRNKKKASSAMIVKSRHDRKK
ncbi:MAG: 50S ribosomal protein L2 [Proteobacteria bacterium]|nr:50S ribosomal protein L2 [Pseudomonadota bacterium]